MSRIYAGIFACCVLLAGLTLPDARGVHAQQAVLERSTGSGSGNVGPFRTDGPWMLTWNAQSEFPALAEFAVHLYEARSGRFVGVVVNQTGTGSGQKAILEPGEYRAVVIARAVDWSVRIDEAPREIADFMRRRPDVSRVDLVPPRTGLVREDVEAVRGWAAESDYLLILNLADDRRLRVRFIDYGACPGLTETADISFVTAGRDRDLYNAILTQEGVRCYIGTATPTTVPVR